ncbi:P-loop containing nucleoside triphosphate hydrolase protein [Phlyctochytrium arcticum]|nr:P-loop containing nucleoside triphosphate hydrolase protein [Phlyctochytrium arcticum]
MLIRPFADPATAQVLRKCCAKLFGFSKAAPKLEIVYVKLQNLARQVPTSNKMVSTTPGGGDGGGGGLMLNFAPPPETPSVVKPKLKVKDLAGSLKGNWKTKRASAKRIIQKVKKAARPPPETTSEETAAQTGEKRKADGDQDNAPPYKRRPVVPGKQIVSSIFTANPDIPETVPEKSDEQGEEIETEDKSSQVPPPPPKALAENTFDKSTFAGLGLVPVLATHITSKLAFKQPTPIQAAALPSLLSHADKDHVLQAQTGSGKTLAFLLPILQRLLLGEEECEGRVSRGGAGLERGVGTLAIVLTPTRELAKQIEQVLDSLLRYSGRTPVTDENEDEKHEGDGTTGSRKRHWIVSGHVMGGESKKSEKARLRRGITILVSTPGRLLDHLKTTQAFELGNLRWLVLDEADRLLELGFEETLREILSIVAERKKASSIARKRLFMRCWPAERQTVLCSATIQGGVQKLADDLLIEPVFIKAEVPGDKKNTGSEVSKKGKINVPSQLRQQYAMVPAKLRLVTLVGALKGMTRTARQCKIMVFVSSTDSVDFHFHILVNGHRKLEDRLDDVDEDEFDGDGEGDDEEGDGYRKRKEKAIDPAFLPPDAGLLQRGAETPLFPSTLLFKLHGSLPQSARTAAYNAFVQTNQPAILICTDVAARGLDMPDVSAIIQYDPPTDSNDYVHRIGRTARLGRAGEALVFLLPSEAAYLDVLKKEGLKLTQVSHETLLANLIDGSTPLPSKKHPNRKQYEFPASNLHMTLERFVMAHPSTLSLAQKAYTSHIRSYATHVSSERHIFHIKNLHLGHVAKSFALREAPAGLELEKERRTKEKKDEMKREIERTKPGRSMYMRVSGLLMGSVSEFGDGGRETVMGRKRRFQ